MKNVSANIVKAETFRRHYLLRECLTRIANHVIWKNEQKLEIERFRFKQAGK